MWSPAEYVGDSTEAQIDVAHERTLRSVETVQESCFANRDELRSLCLNHRGKKARRPSGKRGAMDAYHLLSR